MQIIINEVPIYFEVQFSKRSKINLDVSPEGYLTLKVPTKTSEDEIMTYMKSQSKFLLNLQEKLNNRKYISNQKSYDNEELFLYLGKGFPLHELLDEIPETEVEIQSQLKKLYTKKTKQYVKKRVTYFEKIIGVKAKSITVVDSPRTWGTCNSNKDLTFNYKLSMAPTNVIDYVVIHELCHIHHMNHDRSFWRKVGMYDPNYKQHQAYLEKFGGVMTI
ncbi:M48 family metallopeptidase [Turicibacter bilis]|uniref:M48 family metallopeptidase n=1 Tax=Turicibacter bilis TaxID=2735723 RepID=A0ABY5JNE3_9FIRM|nr:M48 family metallopeptidase [Turicibacter bilis]MBS3199905.1 M48 family metallopeptidase [Turicibacter bilis]UUF06771.1 M48 family metallopeptidase [Turicibacter bilis]